jgi:ABC-2 type transport system permease protein
MVNNAASMIFGFVYISIWQAAARQGGSGVYSSQMLVWYMAYSQSILWITTFMIAGLDIQIKVRSGAVALEMMRPVDFFLMTVSRELGSLVYSLLFRTLPIAAAFALAVGFYVPSGGLVWIWILLSVVLGAWVGMCLIYLVGISSFWTWEIGWCHTLQYSVNMLFSGYMVPLDLMPPWLEQIARGLPFAAQSFYPVRIYLQLSGPEALLPGAIWAFILTLICLGVTSLARERLEVQGG